MAVNWDERLASRSDTFISCGRIPGAAQWTGGWLGQSCSGCGGDRNVCLIVVVVVVAIAVALAVAVVVVVVAVVVVVVVVVVVECIIIFRAFIPQWWYSEAVAILLSLCLDWYGWIGLGSVLCVCCVRACVCVCCPLLVIRLKLVVCQFTGNWMWRRKVIRILQIGRLMSMEFGLTVWM